MLTPYKVNLNLFRGAALIPYSSLTLTVLAFSTLEALNRAEMEMNVALDDIEYAAATDAHTLWDVTPREPEPLQALPVAA